MASSFSDSQWPPPWPDLGRCQQFWIPSLGTFGPHCLGIVEIAPSAIAITTSVLYYGLYPAWRRRPTWLRSFAAECTLHPPAAGLRTWKKSWTPWSLSLASLSLASAALSIGGIWTSQLHVTAIAPSLLSVLILAIDRPQSTPGLVLIFNAVLLLVEVAILAFVPGVVAGLSGGIWLVTTGLTFASILVLLNMPLRDPRLENKDVSKPFTTPTVELRSPEDTITLWQWMSVNWMAPLISVAIQRQLHDEDVWLLPFAFQHRRLHHLFRELTGSVISRLVQANGPDLLIVTGLGVFETLAELSQIVLSKQLLAALRQEPSDSRAAMVYAGLILFAQLAKAQSGVFSLWFGRRCYERSRGEMITMIYEKTIRRKAFTFPSSLETKESGETLDSGALSSATLTDDESDGGGEESSDASPDKTKAPSLGWIPASLFRKRGSTTRLKTSSVAAAATGPASTGKILNLMRSDVYEVAQRFWEFATLTTKPLSFILSLVLLWRILGPASLLGMLTLVAGQLVNVVLLRQMLRVERARRSVTDLKLQQTSQFVEAIRHLRWYDWQDAWLAKIMESRQVELTKRVIVNVLSKVINTVNQFAAYTFPIAAFVAYTVVSRKPLTVDVAFPAIGLFDLIQIGLQELPGLFTVLLNARVAMGRIEDFMAEPDKEDLEEQHLGPPLLSDASNEPVIQIKDASFTWPGATRHVLRDVSLLCKVGLTVVCGRVGTGKTALLHAILGELDQLGGERSTPNEMIGYATQTAWLQSMSIRDNILFCAEYDDARYRQVLDACCLVPDLASFKAGDLSMIGENGVGLSGGQRARVALARALYSRSRILLLDDPIAALDHQTAESIVEKLFARKSALMRNRLVVFVTHRVDLVTKYAYQVVEVAKQGEVRTLSSEELDETVTDFSSPDAVTDEAQQENDAIPDKLIEEEHRAHGGVMASVYWQYVKAGKLHLWVAMVVFFVLFRLAQFAYFWFLKQWGEAYGTEPNLLYSSFFPAAWAEQTGQLQTSFQSRHLYYVTSNDWFGLIPDLPAPDVDVRPWLFWSFILSLVQVLAIAASDFIIVVIVYNAGKRLFQDAMRRVGNAVFRFYDTTPVGRLMNRLTSDMGTVDGQIANQLQQVAWYLVNWIAAVVVVGSLTPSFLAVTFLVTGLFIWIFLRFLPGSQSLRRLEMVSLSPLMSNFGTLLDGLTTVRAFKAQPLFEDRIIVTTDAFQKMDHFYWSLQSWLQYRFDALSALTTFALTATALYSGLSSGMVAFVLTSATKFVGSTHTLCRKYGELQMQFVSVERVMELLGLEQEPCGTISPPAAWPNFADEIVFDNVTLRYAANLEPSLQSVSFRIPAGANVAVTGRTGSGKSTLALALLGTVLPDPEGGGTISIGGVDVAQVDKHALRRSISFVPQDPVLFPGTLRDNLDPLHEHDDAACAAVLTCVLGGDTVAAGVATTFQLDSRVDGGGKNLSQGQRQLIGLGRAILRRSPLVILDEATASIDTRTALEIQAVLREQLALSTVITIAHRVEAVRDANFRIVLDKGRVVEWGPAEGV